MAWSGGGGYRLAMVESSAGTGLRASLGKFWTLSNLLSLLRLALAGPIMYLILVERWRPFMLSLVVIAILSDWLDGQVARWTGTISGWGKILDPLADKIAFGLGTLALTIIGQVPWWFLGLLIGRDLVIMASTSLLIWKAHYVVPANVWGKAATVALAITLTLSLLNVGPQRLAPCLGLTAMLLIVSALAYVYQDIRLLRGRATPMVHHYSA